MAANKSLSPLYENQIYHVYNRGNNGENLFYKHDNYSYFLQQYYFHLSPYLETFAYCLLPNHFHLLVRIKSYKDFPEQREAISLRNGISIAPEYLASEHFRRFFIGYAKAINKQESRTGSLFQKPFKRKPVNDEHYFSQLVYYIHANPQLHGISDDFRTYPYSSYNSLPSEKSTKLLREEVLEWFGSKKSYYIFHDQEQNIKPIKDLMIEE